MSQGCRKIWKSGGKGTISKSLYSLQKLGVKRGNCTHCPFAPSSDGPERLAKHSKHSMYILGQWALIICCLPHWSSLNYFMGRLGRAACKVLLISAQDQPERKQSNKSFMSPNIYCDSEKKESRQTSVGTVSSCALVIVVPILSCCELYEQKSSWIVKKLGQT